MGWNSSAPTENRQATALLRRLGKPLLMLS